MASCLLNVLEANEREKAANAVVIVDDLGNRQRHEPIIRQIAAGFSTRVHYVENNYSPKWVFENYGGIRNSCLAQALAFKDDLLMLDDDVKVLENCLSKHKELLKSHEVVQGGVHGGQAGVWFIIKTMHLALEAFENGEDKEKIITIIKNALRGVSMDDYCQKYTGANLSVSFEAARKHCFLPTPIRFEDGLYCNTAKYFTGEAYAPEDAPLAYHQPSLRDIGFFSRAWVDAINGSAIGLSIDYLLANKTTPEKAAEEGPKKLFESIKNDKKEEKFGELVNRLGDKEIQAEYTKWAEYKQTPSFEFILENIELFSETRKAWERFKPASIK